MVGPNQRMIRLEFVTEDTGILCPRTQLQVTQEWDEIKEMNVW